MVGASEESLQWPQGQGWQMLGEDTDMFEVVEKWGGQEP